MRVTATVDLAVIDHEPPGPGFANLPGLGENAPPLNPVNVTSTSHVGGRSVVTSVVAAAVAVVVVAAEGNTGV